MYRLWAVLTAFIICTPVVFGKTVIGVFKSDAARQQIGQYITKFMYHGGGGRVVCRLENAPLAVEKDARLLLFQDLEDGFDNLSCLERLSRAQLSIPLIQEEHNQSIPPQASPQTWHALYSDRYTCRHQDAIPAQEDLHFLLMLLNPDGAGNPLEHFSSEEAGLHSFYFLLILAYFLASCIYVQPLWHALRKGGPMHTVLKVLSIALALQGVSALCNYVHLARYCRDGLGVPLMGSLAELCEVVSQVSMLYMLLSLCLGWTLGRSRKTQSRPLQWSSSPLSTALALGGVATQGALLLWEQLEETEHHGFHGQRSVAGLLLIALRVGLALLLGSGLYQATCSERSTLKRDFYVTFAKGCLLWFLCQPVLVLLSGLFNLHQRQKVVTIGVILCQSISVVILYQLFLSRSLYWEVSSLSSVSLPLTMSRGGWGGH
ncbi:integral membrane protein GPR180 [Osmerus mordax]|uniref:integral membrane protein GPR180 n=1 Tax=Osmerus mordax TaxID=8014 RepID=UPI00350FEC72